MENQDLLQEVKEKAKQWLTETYDEETRKEVQNLLESDDSTELVDSFYKSLGKKSWKGREIDFRKSL